MAVAVTSHRELAYAPGLGERARLYALVLVLGSCFGLQYAMARMMGAAQVDSVGALFSIHLVLATVFVGVTILTRRTFAPTVKQLAFFGVVALFGNLGQLGIELLAAHHVSTGELTLIISLFPVFVLMLSALTRSERLTGKRIGGIVIGALCSIAILLPGALKQHSDVTWLAITFASPLSQAIGAVIMVRFWPRSLDPMQVATGNLLAGTLLLMPVAVLSGGFALDANSLAGIWAIGGFAATVAGEFYIFAVLSRRGGAVIASCADFVAVAAGLLFGYLFFAEVPTPWMAAAAILCIAALKLAMDKKVA